MRTSWTLSRWIPPATWNRHRPLGASLLGRRAGRASLLAGLVLGLLLGLSGCGAGDGDGSATRPDPSVTATAPTRPDRTSADTPTSDRTPTSADRPSSPTTTPATAAAGTPAAAESQGLGALGWTLLILLVVALAVGWLIWRSRRKSAWDAQSLALEADTRTVTGTQLPPILTAEDAGQRALSWPPLRAALSDLMRRWDLLAERAPDDQRRNRTRQIRNLLQELVAAVDAENQAMAAERDWRLLRPRVDQAERALSAVLSGVPQPEPSARGEPWQPTPGG